ncbi:RNA-directed DNA polymerase, eukaryota, reverse transcriptase zinc-binding domain protein [Tanacetum coccineum]
MNKVEPKKLSVWVKIVNVPLEAWCVKGISAMASSLGKPILMDSMTATMCHKGTGNISYARVLVEMDSEKELKNEIEIQYVDKCKNVKGNKKVQVTYDWKPPICTHCKVFGHELWNCNNEGNVNNGNKSSKDDEENKEKDGGSGGIRHDKMLSL